MKFTQSQEFQKELKKLTKKWQSIPDDIVVAQKVLGAVYSQGNEVFKDSFFGGKKATVLSQNEKSEAVKMLLDCRSLAGKDALRLVFVFVVIENEIIMIELFSKTDKPREDQHRLDKYTR